MTEKNEITESGEVSVTVKSKECWGKMMKVIKDEGWRRAHKLKNQGRKFDVGILAPKEAPSGDIPSGESNIPLASVKLDLDWKIITRLEMVELARDFITKALMLEQLNPALPMTLSTIIEGRSLYEHNIGEFFLLYGRFEQKHKTSGRGTAAKMKELIKDESEYKKGYINKKNEQEKVPLPFAIRNIYAHKGTDENNTTEDELKKSIKMLNSWVEIDDASEQP